jgi:hypothetical protein
MMNLLIVTLVHFYIIMIFLSLKRIVILKQRMFFSPINILFLFTVLYLIGFYARYFFYYDIYFGFISDSTYEIYSLFLLLFFSIFAVSYIIIKPYKLINTLNNRLQNLKLSNSKVNFYIKAFLVYLMAFGLLSVLIKKTGISPFQDPLEFRIQAGHNFGIIFVLMLYFFSLPLFYSIYLKIKNNISKFQFYIIMIFTVLVFFFFGSRMLLLSLIVNFIMIESFFKVKIKKKSFLIKFLLLMIALFFVVIYGSYRDIASKGDTLMMALNLIIDNFGDIFLFYVSEPLVRFSQFVHFLWIIEYEKIGVLNMQYGETLLNFFNTYIPRFLYADKPLFLSMEIQKTLSGATSTPRTASGYFFAEAYLNLYWFSLLIYPIILAFVIKTLQMLYRISDMNKNFVFFFIYKDLMWYLYIIYDGLNSISLQLILILFILNLLSLFIFKKRNSQIVTQ